MPTKSEYHRGLERVLNNPQTSFLHSGDVFREIHKQSGMPLTSMLRHIGKGSKNKNREPTDKERSEQRLKEMEAKSAEKK
jgi:cytidylate kinase